MIRQAKIGGDQAILAGRAIVAEAFEDIRSAGEGAAQEAAANARLIAAAPTLAADTLRLLDEIERLATENERLRYVLDGVAAAIDTGRNEPLHIWRGQIDIVRDALSEGDLA